SISAASPHSIADSLAADLIPGTRARTKLIPIVRLPVRQKKPMKLKHSISIQHALVFFGILSMSLLTATNFQVACGAQSTGVKQSAPASGQNSKKFLKNT